MSQRCSRSSTRAGIDGHVLVIDDASPDGTGAIADRLAAAEPRVRVLHRAGQERHRPGLPRRLPHGARRRGRARHGDGLRLLPRPGTTCRAWWPPRPEPTWCSARATCRAAAVRDWGPVRRAISRGGLPLRPARAGGAGPRPHRGLQVLPPRGAGGPPARRGQRRAATASRSR